VRASLVEALGLDLVGPAPGHELAEERLPGNTRPSSWYLTGFLVPSGTAPEAAADEGEEDGDLDEVPDLPGLSEESTEDRKAAKRVLLPSSMGLSFLVNPGTLEVVVRWGDYERSGRGGRSWQRTAREQQLHVHLAGPARSTLDVPKSGGLQLVVSARKAPALPGVPEAALQASIFLVNRREPSSEVDGRERTYAFQAQVEVRTPGSFFLARPDPRPVPTTNGTTAWPHSTTGTRRVSPPDTASRRSGTTCATAVVEAFGPPGCRKPKWRRRRRSSRRVSTSRWSVWAR